MKAILVDDERGVIDHLVYHMSRLPEISQITPFTDPVQALEHVGSQAVDIAFLDIELGEMNGIELAKRIKAVRPKTNIIFITGHGGYALDAFKVQASDFLLKPVSEKSIRAALENLRHPCFSASRRIRVQTFGNFGVFADGKPLHISCAKAKELLAYLVDRRGVPATAEQIAAVLWEDREYNRSLLKQTQTVISRLKSILKSAGIEEMLIKGWNSVAIDTDVFECDYYQFLDGQPSAINRYTGEYLSEYSWAEQTAGMLSFKKI